MANLVSWLRGTSAWAEVKAELAWIAAPRGAVSSAAWSKRVFGAVVYDAPAEAFTVGCVDVAPAWLGRLAPGGFCVVPLEHGGWHPLTSAEPNGDGARLTVLGPAGFVAIQGQQAGCRPWPHAGRLGPEPRGRMVPLPDELAAGLLPGAGE